MVISGANRYTIPLKITIQPSTAMIVFQLLSKVLYARTLSTPNQILNIPNKYNSLKQIYQGLEDAQVASNVDLGHARFMILRELNRIRNKEFVDSNSFWKKREVFRRLTGEVYDRLNPPMVS